MKPLVVDVRPLVAKGAAPLPVILDALTRLQEGQALQVIAPFEPKPLYRLMQDRGYTYVAEARPPEGWWILFHDSSRVEGG